MASAARYLNLDVGELVKLTAASRLAAASLKRIDGEALRAQTDAAGRANRPSNAILLELQKQRQSAIQAGINQVKRNLSDASWKKVQALVNGGLRL